MRQRAPAGHDHRAHIEIHDPVVLVIVHFSRLTRPSMSTGVVDQQIQSTQAFGGVIDQPPCLAGITDVRLQA